ncbi:EF-hand domain-containing protein [Oricola sp.]|uniref:EF-hand domain-containing protein n=1 Tax=Oricola sp. TaxID=1979950 RepID=UPI003BA8D870
MNTKSRITLLIAGIALATGTVASAYAEGGHKWNRGEGPRAERMGGGHAMGRMIKQADADEDGVITYEEFSAVGVGRFTDADANGDGNISADEIVAAMERERVQRRAERMIKRFDANEDGVVSLEEIETRQQKLFALADRDDSGAIEADELPKFEGRGHGKRHRR